jgi:hypothetical protein
MHAGIVVQHPTIANPDAFPGARDHINSRFWQKEFFNFLALHAVFIHGAPVLFVIAPCFRRRDNGPGRCTRVDS